MQGDDHVVLFNRRVRVFEVEAVGDLSLSLINGVSHLLGIDFGDNIKTGHEKYRIGIDIEGVAGDIRRYHSGSTYGSVPERPKGADCKSAGIAFGGSNPPRPTNNRDVTASANNRISPTPFRAGRRSSDRLETVRA